MSSAIAKDLDLASCRGELFTVNPNLDEAVGDSAAKRWSISSGSFLPNSFGLLDGFSVESGTSMQMLSWLSTRSCKICPGSDMLRGNDSGVREDEGFEILSGIVDAGADLDLRKAKGDSWLAGTSKVLAGWESAPD